MPPVAARLKDLLDETRLAMPGTQILLGLQHRAAFSERFMRLPGAVQKPPALRCRGNGRRCVRHAAHRDRRSCDRSGILHREAIGFAVLLYALPLAARSRSQPAQTPSAP
jgi:hypothetical protein